MILRNKRILLTGGFGFLGRRLAVELLKKNCSITIIDKSIPNKKNTSFVKDTEVIIGDCKNKDITDQIKHDIDFIFHFGAPSSVVLFHKHESAKLLDTILGFFNIIQLAQKRNVEKLVYPSSGSVYGYTKPPQKETMSLNTTNLYGVGKIACEKIASAYSNLNSVGLRIFAGYGPGEGHKKTYASPVTLFLASMLRKKSPRVFGNGEQSRDFVYIDDVVKCIIKSAERNTPHILNIGSGKSYTFLDVIDKINKILGSNIRPTFIQKPANYLENTKADITLMRKYLQVYPRDLDKGLKDYLKEIHV